MAETGASTWPDRLQDLEYKGGRLGAAFCAIAVPMFMVVDWFYLPDNVRFKVMTIRVVLSLFSILVCACFFMAPRWTWRWAHWASPGLLLVVGGGISFMCWLDSGYQSPYYAGISLVVLSAGALFSWRARRSLMIFGLIYLFYMLPLFFGWWPGLDRDGMSWDQIVWKVVGANQAFLLSTIAITVLSQGLRHNLEKTAFEAIQSERAAKEHAEALATQDPLTGLLNRRAFFAQGTQEVSRAKRYVRALSVIMMDIDFFKRINDTFGHQAGDEVLRTVSARLSDTLRQQDVICRYGGEEFVILLPETHEGPSGQVVAERLREIIERQPVETAQGPVPVTASFGVTAFSADSTLESLLQRADKALYQAKEGGRNQVVLLA